MGEPSVLYHIYRTRVKNPSLFYYKKGNNFSCSCSVWETDSHQRGPTTFMLTHTGKPARSENQHAALLSRSPLPSLVRLQTHTPGRRHFSNDLTTERKQLTCNLQDLRTLHPAGHDQEVSKCQHPSPMCRDAAVTGMGKGERGSPMASGGTAVPLLGWMSASQINELLF